MAQGYNNENAERLGVSAGNVASFLLVGKVLAVIAGAINFIIIARLLQPSNYGLYTLAIGLFGLFSTFAGLNVSAYFNKRIPELVGSKDQYQISRVLGNGFAISIMLALIFATIGILGVNIINGYIFHSQAANIIIEITAIGTIISIIWTNLYAALISFGEGKHAAISSVISAVVQAAVSISLVFYGFGVAGALVGIFAGLIVGVAYGFVFLYKYSSIVFDAKYFVKRAKDIVTFSVPLTISNILNSAAGNLAVLFLGSLFAANIIGSYGVATKVGNFMDIIIGSISLVLIPMFASAYARKSVSRHVGRMYDYSIYFGLLFAMPLIVFVVVFSKALVSLLVSASYTATIQVINVPLLGMINAGTPLYVVMVGIGILISIINTFGTALATSKGDVEKVMKYSIIVFIAQMISLIALVPTYGALGVIFSLFYINNIIGVLLFYNYAKQTLKLKIEYNVGKIILSNAILGILLFAVLLAVPNQLFEIFAGGIVILLAYPLILGVLGGIKHYEMNLLRQIGSKMPIIGFLIRPFIEYADMFAK